MAYCTYEDVGTMLGLTFDSSSVPTATKVSGIIDLISSEINVALTAIGISLPTTGDMYNLVKLKTMQGSAGLVAITYYGNSDAVESGQGAYFTNKYKEFLAEIKATPNLFKPQYNTMKISNQFTDGAMTDADLDRIMIGDEVEP
jgi:hypothetical protein